MNKMILVTGGTGFIGKALIRHLTEAGYLVRTLVKPSKQSPNLPKGIPLEVVVSDINDERGMRSAMVGVDTVFHLAGAEWKGSHGNLFRVDIQGTQNVLKTAQDANVRRFFYISHLGADRASAFPVLKAKAIAEEHIRHSGLDYTIFRSAIVYGTGDAFTTGLARVMRAIPGVFFLPDDGNIQLQPIWIEDLVTCLLWSFEDEGTRNQLYSIGGPEYLLFKQVVQNIMGATEIHRTLVSMYPPYLRALTVFLESIIPGLPISTYWLDYMAVNRTCSLDTIPRLFNLMPGRFAYHLDHLRGEEWRTSLLRSLFRRKR
jgi:NADH dehydrogenase